MASTKGLHELFRAQTTSLDHLSDTPLTIWSMPQFEEFQTTFSHGLVGLQHHLAVLPSGQCTPDNSALLMSSITSMARAMTKFLQRRFAMMQRLEGLGRVVETESSKTWYAQPENLWLRKAVADLKAKCDAFSWLVLEICQARQNLKYASMTMASPSTAGRRGTSRSRLRSYNSFSSLGSETPRGRVQNPFESQQYGLADSTDSTPVTKSFSNRSSIYSRAAFSTGPSSLNPNSPVESHGSCEGQLPLTTRDEDIFRKANCLGLSEHTLSAALRELLKLNISGV